MNELAAVCDGCHVAVAPGGGYVGVNHSAISRHRAAEQEWNQAHPGDLHSVDELLEGPETIRWHVYHFACDPQPDEDGYQLDVEDVDSLAGLMHWTAHLMRKTWIGATDWDDLVRGAVDGTSGRRLVPRRAAA